ncbi:MAG: RNA polymerase sigma factor [Eubacteriales bacterium]
MTDKRTVKKINRCIRQIALGRMSALEELFVLTKKYLFVVAKAYLWDKSKAEDVLSDSYFKVVKSAGSFDTSRNGYSWLYEIVKNTALNQNEKDKLRAHPTLDEIKEPPSDIIDELLTKIMVNQALSQLTEEENALVYKYFFEGLTLQEIADSLRKPKTTVYDQLQRTLMKMKKMLGGADQKPDKTVYQGEDNHEKERH